MSRSGVSLCSLLIGWLAAAPLAHAATDHPRLIRVAPGPAVTAARLNEAGLDVVGRAGGAWLVLEWPSDQAKLAALGVASEVLDEDPGSTAAARARAELASRPRPPGQRVLSATGTSGRFLVQTLPAFGSGSMGGYWTLDEVKMKLDQMVADDAHDVVADKIDTLGYSIEGRPIWGLKLGKSVVGPDARPVAFFNALIHAREPEGMEALLYWADDLVSRYGVDPMATYLLDQRVIYIVPVVNPDGYRHNQTTNPGGGGLWRKNMRDNDGNNHFSTNKDGVDLNRNFGYQWGINNSGSSPNIGDPTYRGTAPFSEPETQAQRDIVVALAPRTGIAFHTWGDTFLHAWGYTVTATDDSAAFYEWSDDAMQGVSYQSGQSTRVLYDVNGEFNDWCYGDTQMKPRAFTWTPEIGSIVDGFWPPPSRILPLAQENVRACTYVAAIAGPYVRAESFSLAEGSLARFSIAHLSVRARNKGVSGSAGPGLTGTLTSLSAGAHVIQDAVSYPTLGSFQSADPLSGGTFVVAADDTVTLGRLLRFQVDFTAPDGLFSRDTVEVLCGQPTVLFADDASAGLGSWNPAAWGIESLDPSHPGPYFADSPGGVYAASSDNALALAQPVTLAPGVHAYLLYDARWDFESDEDAGTIEASTDGTTWTRLSGTSTTLGSGASIIQIDPLPLYDGTRHRWRAERADLSGLMGASVRVRFRAQASSSVNFDGLDVDDVRVVVFDPAQQPPPVAVGDAEPVTRLSLLAPAPDPARALAHLAFALPSTGQVRLEVFDLQGRRVRVLASGVLPAGRGTRAWDLRDDGGRRVKPGVYVARLSGVGASVSRRLVVLP